MNLFMERRVLEMNPETSSADDAGDLVEHLLQLCTIASCLNVEEQEAISFSLDCFRERQLCAQEGLWEWGHAVLNGRWGRRRKGPPGGKSEVPRCTNDCMISITGRVKTDIMYNTATAKRVLRHGRMKRQRREEGWTFCLR